jgi:hypothetical protein
MARRSDQRASPRAECDDAGDGRQAPAPVHPGGADQGLRRKRDHLVHQLRQPQGPRTGANPWAALQFHWVELERVVRIEGRVDKSAPPKATPTSPAARSIHASAPGPARRARSLPAAACWSPTPPAMAPGSCCTAASTALGRLPPASGYLGVLAGQEEPLARPPALPAGQRSAMDSRATGAVLAAGSRRAAPTASPNPGGLRNKRPPLAHRAAIRGRSSHNGGHSSRLVARGRRRHRRPLCRKRHSHPIVARQPDQCSGGPRPTETEPRGATSWNFLQVDDSQGR